VVLGKPLARKEMTSTFLSSTTWKEPAIPSFLGNKAKKLFSSRVVMFSGKPIICDEGKTKGIKIYIVKRGGLLNKRRPACFELLAIKKHSKSLLLLALEKKVCSVLFRQGREHIRKMIPKLGDL